MSPSCRASVLSLSLSLLACFLQVLSQGPELWRRPEARSFFLRSKRANSFLVEEILQGNLERECYEELCSYEEAREYFEDTERTIAFWTVYYDGDQCDPDPCLHGGSCTDKVGGFHCSCRPPHYGAFCELPETRPPPTAALQPRPPGRFHSANHNQVSLVDSTGAELCGGVVLGRRSVLTAASCLLLGSRSDLRPSSFSVVAGNEALPVFVPVQALYIHSRFSPGHHDNDLVLLQLATPLTFGPTLIHLCLPTKDFSENVLMHSGRMGLVVGRADRKQQHLVYMTLGECHSQLKVSHLLSNKMFCMRSQNGRQTQNGGGRHNPDGRHNRRKPQTRTERPDGATECQNSRNDRQHGTQKRLSEILEHQNEKQKSQNESHESQNPRQEIQPGANGTDCHRKAEHQNSSPKNNSSKRDGGLRSEVSRRCSGLLPGSPVATEEKGTAFLTGLLISSPADCENSGGLVFTKLSRYLTWIHQRLQLTEGHMTPQVSQYPEER
ncbi:hypothetical protein LDENG_00285240 [Lucifuga dentata]|nr:hypothetical protein LDENG_00285240 [Lucifuga dentata]